MNSTQLQLDFNTMVTFTQQQQHLGGGDLCLGMSKGTSRTMLKATDLGGHSEGIANNSLCSLAGPLRRIRELFASVPAESSKVRALDDDGVWQEYSKVTVISKGGFVEDDVSDDELWALLNEVLEETAPVVSYDSTSDDGARGIIDDSQRFDSDGDINLLTVASDLAENVVVSVVPPLVTGYVPVVACYPGESDIWGFCYEFLFKKRVRDTVFSYAGVLPYMTRGHYDWLTVENPGFVDEVDCLVYMLEDNGTRKVIHSSLCIDAETAWKALDGIIDWMYPVRFYVHFMPVESVRHGLNPFFKQDGLAAVLRHRVRQKTVFWTVGSMSNLRGIAGMAGLHCLMADKVVEQDLIDVGFDLESVSDLFAALDRDVDAYLVIGRSYSDDSAWDLMATLTIFQPSVIIIYWQRGLDDFFGSELRKNKVPFLDLVTSRAITDISDLDLAVRYDEMEGSLVE